MEDAHTTILTLPTSKCALFAVFDGHGGSNVAIYSGNKLQERLATDEAFKAGLFGQALTQSFLGLDTDLRAGVFSWVMQIHSMQMNHRDARRLQH